MDVLEFIRQNLRPNPVIVEVGMHHGEDTLKFREIFPESFIIGFEPDPRCIDEINRLKLTNFIMIRAAVSSVNGRSYFYQSDSSDGWDGSGSIKKPKEHLNRFPHIYFTKGIPVTTLSLDYALNEYLNPPFEDKPFFSSKETIDLLWVDVQGAERDVFIGAKNTLKRTKYLHFEVYNDVEMYEGQPTLRELMDELGDDWKIIGDDGQGNKLAENINVQLNKRI